MTVNLPLAVSNCRGSFLLLLVLLPLLWTVACRQSEMPPAEPAGKTLEVNGVGVKDDSADPSADPAQPTKEPQDRQSRKQPPIMPEPAHPFPRRSKAAEFPADFQWLNTAGPIRLEDLRGKFVVLDFWTYCCINCMHVLPELKKLERAYAKQVVVIGVHSAKFTTEEDKQNIADAILRYDIEHPVVVDVNHRIWDLYQCRSWPSLRVIDPQGNLVAGHSGEIRFEALEGFFKQAIPYYKKKKLLDETPLRFELLANRQPDTPLRFPGKVLADAESGRLFITDSNHHRIVVTDLSGRLLTVIGSGRQGAADGGFDDAEFHHPQGCALVEETLYVADTENHLIRKIDLKAKRVTTIAGKGVQAEFPWPRPAGVEPGAFSGPWVGRPSKTALNSPWALWIHGDDLYIAMAGPHQIWRMPLNEKEIEPYAGNSREDIVDGRLLPSQPYEVAPLGETPFSSFAQPSGLTSNGTSLFVADSEGSSIRSVPLNGKGMVETIVGTADLAAARLFTFGDRDGERADVRLQHPLGVTWHDGRIYVADTYNNKIKVINAKTGATKTLAGDGKPGTSDSPPRFDEPAGLSYADGKLFVADTNNHLIRVVDVRTGETSTLSIEGLAPPKVSAPAMPTFKADKTVSLGKRRMRAEKGYVSFRMAVDLPEGWKINQDAKPVCWIELPGKGPISRDVPQVRQLETGKKIWTIRLPVTGEGSDVVTIGLEYPYCRNGAEGVCRVGTVAWKIQLEISADAETNLLTLEYDATLPRMIGVGGGFGLGK